MAGFKVTSVVEDGTSLSARVRCLFQGLSDQPDNKNTQPIASAMVGERSTCNSIFTWWMGLEYPRLTRQAGFSQAAALETLKIVHGSEGSKWCQVAVMASVIMLVVLGAGALAAIMVMSPISLYADRGRRDQRHGCQAVRELHRKKCLLGLDLLFETVTRLKSNSYLELLVERFTSIDNNTFLVRFFTELQIVTCEPNNIKAILATQFNDFELGAARRDAFVPLIGHGIFTADDAHWRDARRHLRPSFDHRKHADLSVYESEVRTLIDKLPTADVEVDLCRMFGDLAMRTAARLIFGRSNTSLTDVLPQPTTPFTEAFDRAQRIVSRHFVLGIVSRWHRNSQHQEDCKMVWESVRPIAERALRGQHSASNTSGLIHHIATDVRDPVKLTGAALNLLVAARDTTASLLSNLWFMLARHPVIYAKLRKEVASLNGLDPLAGAERGELRLLHACIKESLRLFPPIPLNFRTATVDTTLPCGGGVNGDDPVFVPKGTTVQYSVFATHRLRSIYGDDSNEFRPERWLNSDLPIKPLWAFLPFSGGPRICLGQHYAWKQVTYVTVELISAIRELQSTDHQRWTEKLQLACTTRHGTRVKIRLE